MKLLPKPKDFLECFQEQSRILVEGADLLLDGVRAGADRYGPTSVRIEQLERNADCIVQMVTTELNRTFVTLYAPEDIHALVSGLDDIIDELEEAAHRISAYRIRPIPPLLLEFAEVLQKSAHAVQQAITALASHDDDSVAGRWLVIDELERQADALMRGALGRLFAATSDAISLIKLKEIYELMENAIDRCKDVADTLRNMVVKQD